MRYATNMATWYILSNKTEACLCTYPVSLRIVEYFEFNILERLYNGFVMDKSRFVVSSQFKQKLDL